VQKKWPGEVWPNCLEGEPDEITEQLKAQAECVRQEAAEVERIAAESIIAPTLEDLKLMESISAL
jgi:hypothetical protein